MSYEPDRTFVPAVDDPGPVSFSEDGSHWTVTRDRFRIGPEGTIQAYVMEIAPDGAPLEPAVKDLRSQSSR